MANKPETSIHFAVQTCLSRCRLSDAPLTSLWEFADEMEKAGWDRQSIEEVERQVLIGLYGRKAFQPIKRHGDANLA